MSEGRLLKILMPKIVGPLFDTWLRWMVVGKGWNFAWY